MFRHPDSRPGASRDTNEGLPRMSAQEKELKHRFFATNA